MAGFNVSLQAGLHTVTDAMRLRYPHVTEADELKLMKVTRLSPS